MKSGQVVQTGGRICSHYTDDSKGIYVGNKSGLSGTYELHDGEISINTIKVGDSGTGLFRQEGGTVKCRKFYLGTHQGATGTYELIDGVLEVTGGREYIGLEAGIHYDANSGLFIQKGGTHKVWDPSSSRGTMFLDGTYRLEGGQLFGYQARVGWLRHGAMIQTGGSSGSKPVT